VADKKIAAAEFFSLLFEFRFLRFSEFLQFCVNIIFSVLQKSGFQAGLPPDEM